MMIIRLHNLSARAPVMADMHAVAELLSLTDDSRPGNVEALENDLRQCWHGLDFALKMDAWVLVANKGQIIGYGDVRCKSERTRHEYVLRLQVHPEYRERGLATLLIWLIEERARQLLQCVPDDEDVVLSSNISSTNQWARDVYTREGYVLARQFWRLVIAVEEVVARSSTELAQPGSLTVDVVLDADAEMDDGQRGPQNSALYTVHQYVVYTKVLRSGRKCEMENVLVTQYDIV
ncbi:MAG: hypothetical protein PVS3B1_30540 [Ktedonobacteraceae bacterium]